MKWIVDALAFEARPRRHVEVVERKGIGHPDTLCDAMAERVCVRLCQFYTEKFGVILHHNVDKILLCGGSSRPAFGGGEITDPIEIYIAGRVTKEWRGVSVPAEEIAIAACLEVLARILPALDPDRDVKVFPRLRPGSNDLTSLFARAGSSSTSIPLANDTSCGAGFAPLSDLENVVLLVERRLNDPETKRLHPEIGADIKVMGLRVEDRIELTVSCAFIGRHLIGLDDYVQKKNALADRVHEVAREVAGLGVHAITTTVNAADDVERGEIFMTVSGTSAESGDDGQVGRGNRASGLITPYRWMTLEATAGKNPVSHVGKLYNVLAERIARRLVTNTPGVRGASCLLLSQIGRAIDDPQLAHVEVSVDGDALDRFERQVVEDVVRGELAKTTELREALVAGQISLF